MILMMDVIRISKRYLFAMVNSGSHLQSNKWEQSNHYIKCSIIISYTLSDSTLCKFLASSAWHAIRLLFNYGIAACQTHLRKDRRGERVTSLCDDTVCSPSPCQLSIMESVHATVNRSQNFHLVVLKPVQARSVEKLHGHFSR